MFSLKFVKKIGVFHFMIVASHKLKQLTKISNVQHLCQHAQVAIVVLLLSLLRCFLLLSHGPHDEL